MGTEAFLSSSAPLPDPPNRRFESMARKRPRPPRQSNELQRVLDAVLDGIVVLSPGAAIEQINSEACRILETSAESAVGSPLAGFFEPGHAVPALVRSVQASRRPAIDNGVSLARRFAGPLEVDVAVSPLGEEDRETGGVVLTLRDRTIGNSMRAELFQREQLHSYGQIAAGIAHEVKNPLGGIRGAAELLARRVPGQRDQQTAALIVREVDRIAALVDELMVFARGDELKLERLNLHRVIDGVLDLLAADPLARDTEWRRIYDPSIPELEADPGRLTQVLLNLTRNAIQAMGEAGGVLSIRTRIALEHRLLGPDGRPEPTVSISLSDTGPGIPEEILARLATPFFTTKPDGTGLGLAVSRHWLARHGGRLRIESGPGPGAVVHVDLPLRTAPQSGSGSGGVKRPGPGEAS